MARRALFLDRDGVINVDHGYVHRIEDFSFLPGIFDLARLAARELGLALVIASNQSGIGRGLYDEAAYERLMDWVCRRFAAEGAPIAGTYHSPFHPTAGIGTYRRDDPSRKPRPGMFLTAAADLGLDLAGSALIGDRIGDMQAGAAAGIGLLLRLDATGNGGVDAPPHEVVADLAAAQSRLRAWAAIWREVETRPARPAV